MEKVKFSFENLIVYQKSPDYIDFVYDICDEFLKFNRYLQIALDSTRECVVCTTIALRRKYISNDKDKIARLRLTELSKMITSLQKRIKNRLTTNH